MHCIENCIADFVTKLVEIGIHFGEIVLVNVVKHAVNEKFVDVEERAEEINQDDDESMIDAFVELASLRDEYVAVESSRDFEHH